MYRRFIRCVDVRSLRCVDVRSLPLDAGTTLGIF